MLGSVSCPLGSRWVSVLFLTGVCSCCLAFSLAGVYCFGVQGLDLWWHNLYLPWRVFAYLNLSRVVLKDCNFVAMSNEIRWWPHGGKKYRCCCSCSTWKAWTSLDTLIHARYNMGRTVQFRLQSRVRARLEPSRTDTKRSAEFNKKWPQSGHWICSRHRSHCHAG